MRVIQISLEDLYIVESKDGAILALFAIGLLAGALLIQTEQELQSTQIQEARSAQDLAAARAALNESLSEQQAILTNYTKMQGTLNAPGVNESIVIWTIPSVVAKKSWTGWALLDTFTNQIDIRTNGTANFQIMDLNAFANFYFGKSYVSAWNYTGNHFVMTVRLTQGCGYYALVVRNLSGHTELLTPNVTARYAPTPFLTGTCAS
jgi:hypothetical protein